MEGVRFVVEWTPWIKVSAAAKKKGWTPAESASDFVNVEDYTTTQAFDAFADAERFARKVIKADTWCAPRIHREELVANDHDDLGNRVKAMPSWEREAHWEVTANEDVREDAPHWLDAA